MKKLSLVLVLLSSPAFAQEAGRAHPLAPECSVTDIDCVRLHDARVTTLATWMGIAAYCRASTRPAACLEAVSMTSGDYVPPAPKLPSGAPTMLDLSGPAEPEAEFPTPEKKGAL